MEEETDLRIFVYGSLVPGGEYWGRYCEGKVVARRRARARGRLHRTRDGYLAMSLEAESKNSGDAAQRKTENSKLETLPWIPGWLLTLCDEAALRAIDGLEGFDPGRLPEQNEYQRVRMECFAEGAIANSPETLGNAWAYVMTAAQLAQAGATAKKNGGFEI